MSRRFAVAARELETGRRGMSRWLSEVLAAWQRDGRAAEVGLYTEAPLAADRVPEGFTTIATGPGPGGGATAWEQWALCRALYRDRPAAFLGPANSLPIAGPVPAVLVLHDLSFEAHPEWFKLSEGARRRLLARASVRRARRVLVDSAFTAAELDRLYGVGGDRVQVVPCGVSARFSPDADPAELAAVRRRLALDGTLVLAVGSLFQRRHVPELIAAFASLLGDRPDLRLVLVGDNRTHPRLDLERLFRTAGVAARTTWIESVDDETLLALYRMARVTVYLSDYEGFGLPPLEALGCGCPVVASATSALAENLTGRARLVSEHTPEAIAAAIAATLEAPPPARMRPAWLAELTWERTAAAVWRALEEAV